MKGFKLKSIILLINYSLYVPKRYVCGFHIFKFYYLIFYTLTLHRLAMLFAVCSYTIFICVCVYVNKGILFYIFLITQNCTSSFLVDSRYYSSSVSISVPIFW